ncbi:hypothetical protein AK812_SmicGene8559 [Symbiodinium microadriaticum]|uniref:Uncharacterized protein n=1 Tax=Symbiodinium microadriaticum TaxID=2951 RepID=A0A1Q9EKQ3_SYMMI|nr:hypothetical protein AK812_SmicGene8559 [Symbiodinium microadriaticum]
MMCLSLPRWRAAILDVSELDEVWRAIAHYAAVQVDEALMQRLRTEPTAIAGLPGASLKLSGPERLIRPALREHLDVLRARGVSPDRRRGLDLSQEFDVHVFGVGRWVVTVMGLPYGLRFGTWLRSSPVRTGLLLELPVSLLLALLLLLTAYVRDIIIGTFASLADRFIRASDFARGGRGALRLRYVEIELCLHGAFDDLRGKTQVELQAERNEVVRHQIADFGSMVDEQHGWAERQLLQGFRPRPMAAAALARGDARFWKF